MNIFKTPLRLIADGTKIGFMHQHRLAFWLSAFLCMASIALILPKGLNFGIDFTGGVLIEVKLPNPVEISTLRADLNATLPGVDLSLQQLDSPQHLLIRAGGKVIEERGTGTIISEIKTMLASISSGTVDYRKIDMVGPQLGAELLTKSALALVAAFAGIMLYLSIRFEWYYGVGAVVSLVHDAILTLGFMSAAELECNAASIAAILTVIGYSVNDSVVIYDRIRENLKKYSRQSMVVFLDLSLNETLSRTILTVLTTLLAALALIVLGGSVIRSFSVTVFVGIIIGTYSSIYISAPLLIYTGFRDAGANK